MWLLHMAAVLPMRISLVIYLLGMILVCGTADDQELVPSFKTEASQISSVRPKTVVSSKLRVIAVVGLEGSGHHFFNKALSAVFPAHRELAVIDGCFIARGIYVDRSMGHTASDYHQWCEGMRSGMKSLSKHAENLEAPGTILAVQRQVNMERKECSLEGQMSYPNGHGPNKAMKYADVQQVAQLADEEGVDFRIVYLQRSAKSLLIASTVHRGFQHHLNGMGVRDSRDPEVKFLEYAQILLADTAVIHSMFSELGPGFIICHFYDKVASENQARAIADFLAPNEVIAGYLRDSMLKYARVPDSRVEHLPFANVSAVVERIERKLSVIEEQHCGSQAVQRS